MDDHTLSPSSWLFRSERSGLAQPKRAEAEIGVSLSRAASSARSCTVKSASVRGRYSGGGRVLDLPPRLLRRWRCAPSYPPNWCAHRPSLERSERARQRRTSRRSSVQRRPRHRRGAPPRCLPPRAVRRHEHAIRQHRLGVPAVQRRVVGRHHRPDRNFVLRRPCRLFGGYQSFSQAVKIAAKRRKHPVGWRKSHGKGLSIELNAVNLALAALVRVGPAAGVAAYRGRTSASSCPWLASTNTTFGQERWRPLARLNRRPTSRSTA